MMTTSVDLSAEGGRAETVTDFTRRVKRLLEGGIRPGWIRGEVSNLRAQASGHVYFSLKDATAQVSAVLFRGDALRQTAKLRDGAQVVVFGEMSVYEARGQYQLIVRAVVEDGVGRLQREFEALKARLATEGLFAKERKKRIPTMPVTVAFITSPTGAAVQDFARIVTRRKWCGRVIVLPAKVQGEGAAAEIVGMLKLAERMGIFDLVVLGRGGGSLEDLWAFNEEMLVRAVAASPLPTISAVGHEIDFTLCDFVADLRAETPSAAAELITSHFVGCSDRVRLATDSLTGALTARMGAMAAELDHARSRLRLLSPAAQIEQGYLRLDDLANRLSAGLRHRVQDSRHALAAMAAGLARVSPERRVQFESHRLLALWKRLQGASPRSVLNRGYAIVRDGAGQPVLRAAGLTEHQALTAEFGDGRVAVRVERPMESGQS